jgi:hypothetical protein
MNVGCIDRVAVMPIGYLGQQLRNIICVACKDVWFFNVSHKFKIRRAILIVQTRNAKSLPQAILSAVMGGRLIDPARAARRM